MQLSNKQSIFVAVVITALVVVGLSYGINTIQQDLYNKGYNAGVLDHMTNIYNQVQSRGYFEMPISENQSLILVPYKPTS